MKKIILAILLVAAVVAVAQTAAPPVPQSAPPVPQAAPPVPQNAPPVPAAPQKKEIKDPAEYNAYMGAAQQKDAAAKVSGLEAFVTQYPNSVMKEDALELLMGAYQQTGNQAKTLDTAQKVLQANACNIRALALLAYTENLQQKFADAGKTGENGLACLQTAAKPEGMTVEDWGKLKDGAAVIFNGAAGISAFQVTVQAKGTDYSKAEKYLRAAVDADPTNLLNVYDLARSYLAVDTDPKFVDGLFFIARASNLAQGTGKEQIAKYGKSKYIKYHGSDEGWSDLLAKAATMPLPTGIAIAKYVPPTPAEQCSTLLKTETPADASQLTELIKKKVGGLSFAEWQLCLSEGTPADAEKVWTVIKGKPLQMLAHIVAIDPPSKVDVKGKSVDAPTKLHLAGSEDDVEAKRADIDLAMSAAIPPKDMPKEDTDFKFEGTPVSYVAKPFVMTMNEGALLVSAPAKKPTPVHKKPVAH